MFLFKVGDKTKGGGAIPKRFEAIPKGIRAIPKGIGTIPLVLTVQTHPTIGFLIFCLIIICCLIAYRCLYMGLTKKATI